MVELVAKSPCEGLLPLSIGSVRVSEVNPTSLTSIAPFQGKDAQVAKSLKAQSGLEWPAPLGSTQAGDAKALWFGAHIVVMNGGALNDLASDAAVTDQSDAWSVVMVSGEEAEAVLSRVCPIDVRVSAMPVGAAVRTQLMHMTVSLLRLSETEFQVMAFRSMAKTLIHDLETAMKMVHARTLV